MSKIKSDIIMYNNLTYYKAYRTYRKYRKK